MSNSKKTRTPFRTRPPIIDFTQTLLHCGVDPKYYPRILIYYIKLGFFEPFRLIERLLMATKYRDFELSAPPVFILGYYRSGTTHLQEVLLQDKRFGFLNFYTCYFQGGALVTQRIFKWTFQKIMTFLRFRHPAHNIPFLFDMPGEEDVSMVSSGFRYACSFGQVFPRSFREYFTKFVFFEGCTKQEASDFEYEMKDFIKRIAISNDNKPLLLKSPPQTARLKWLAERYPGAKFIFIYRNPHLVFRSNLKLWGTFKGQWLQSLDPAVARENVLWSFEKTLQAYEKDAAGMSKNQLIEVRYEEFMQSPMTELKKIYDQLELPGFDEAKPEFESFLARQHGANVDRYSFREEDFRVVESRWGYWLRKWNYSRP